jgi:hypothetical protein
MQSFTPVLGSTLHLGGVGKNRIGKVHWNTVYLDRAVRQLRAQGADVPDDLLAHVAPLGWEHIGLTGDYAFRSASAHVGPFWNAAFG